MDTKLISLHFYNVEIVAITKNGNAFVNITLSPEETIKRVLIRRQLFNALINGYDIEIIGAIIDQQLPDKNGNVDGTIPVKVFKTLKF